MASTSPMKGTHERSAIHAPYLSILALCLAMDSGLAPSFSIHSHLPIRPMPYEVRPPRKLPIVAMAITAQGEPPATSIPTNRTSALNGTTVDARNDPIKSPKYPKSNSQSIASAKIRIQNAECKISFSFSALLFVALFGLFFARISAKSIRL